MKFLILLAGLSIFCDLGESFVIDCDFLESETFGYYCGVQDTELETSKYDCKVSKVEGTHLNEKTNDDVIYFYSLAKKFHCFPKRVSKFFKNLESVAIYDANIKAITQEDLKQFGGNLRNLWLTGNQIEVIESDLYEFNPNLEEFDLRGNKISHIESGVFDNLKSFKELFLTGNPCQFINSIQETEEKCKDPNYVPRPMVELTAQ